MRRVHNVEKLWGCNINNFTLLLQWFRCDCN